MRTVHEEEFWTWTHSGPVNICDFRNKDELEHIVDQWLPVKNSAGKRWLCETYVNCPWRRILDLIRWRFYYGEKIIKFCFEIHYF